MVLEILFSSFFFVEIYWTKSIRMEYMSTRKNSAKLLKEKDFPFVELKKKKKELEILTLRIITHEKLSCAC